MSYKWPKVYFLILWGLKITVYMESVVLAVYFWFLLKLIFVRWEMLTRSVNHVAVHSPVLNPLPSRG